MSKNGKTLKMDLSNCSEMIGDPKSLAAGHDEDFYSKINMILPFSLNEIQNKKYSVEYNSHPIEIFIQTIYSKEQDPIYNETKNQYYGTPEGSGFPEMLPFAFFTDNRGIYPAILAIIVFPYRIATWIDNNNEDGLKKTDFEVMKITGGWDQLNKEKIIAISVINRLINSIGNKNLKPIKYEDITVFIETYFKKGESGPLLGRINSLTSKDAYKNAVREYFLKEFGNSEISNTLECLHNNISLSEIKSESDLQKIIAKTIEDVLVHHIEIRRWIEPFWDGERKIKLEDGKETIIPRSPKDETKIQPTLHVLLDMALAPMGIQVTRESYEGIGALDFRFLFTTKELLPLSIGVEFKVAHHKEIKKGINRQLPAYMKSIRSKYGFFVVMWFKDDKYFKRPENRDKEQMRCWIRDEASKASIKQDLSISSYLLDASIRPSASNL